MYVLFGMGALGGDGQHTVPGRPPIAEIQFSVAGRPVLHQARRLLEEGGPQSDSGQPLGSFLWQPGAGADFQVPLLHPDLPISCDLYTEWAGSQPHVDLRRRSPYRDRTTLLAVAEVNESGVSEYGVSRVCDLRI